MSSLLPATPAASGRKRGAPRNKLTEEMLKGESGVDALFRELKSVRFSVDEGQLQSVEAQERNLRLLLHKYETWGRQLVPQATFDEFVASLEKLMGRSCMKCRMANLAEGIPFGSDLMDEGGEGEPAAPAQAEEVPAIVPPTAVTAATAVRAATAVTGTAGTPSSSALTAEQLERIEKNKQRALEIRRQRELAQQQQQQQQSQHDGHEEADK